MLGSLFIFAAMAATCLGASLQGVTNWGTNPTNITMYIYVPDQLAANPPIIVAIHSCQRDALNWYNRTTLPSYADANGFILIYPETPNFNHCWDVHNTATLTHNEGGDALGIINMINYTLSTYNGDSTRVFAMGFSSGGMMTNALAGTYPNVFEAAAAYSGVAHACSAGSPCSTPFCQNQTCAQGLEHTSTEWGNFVRNSYPGYTEKRPRMMIVHGTNDTLVRPKCAVEALKQWSEVLGVPFTKNVTGVPSAEYTQMVYGDGTQLQGYFAEGVGHTSLVNEDIMLRFFGLIA
ncbi:carbohydrate esterase family 1 protein [Pseudomassariella vexata]|uniref:Carboxylic ester hydrolase n=1 Tax=Pseudomassariella vexata TaxID=1141098 RepID=A0A1Y2D8V4_9PEZI|nr:carbohydrate esterase family 1 protein [Pseudomassariella vexata]ORY55689.1 carbohydrate esterase family 1 protein [Pseudomassariella vexata]